MKNTFFFSLIFIMTTSLYANYKFENLQSLTNTIINANKKICYYDLYSDSLQYLNKINERVDIVDPQELSEAKAITNCFAESIVFDRISPSEALPLLFALLEIDALTDWKCKLLDDKYCGSFGEFVYQLIIDKLKISTQEDRKNIMMLWLPHQSVMWNKHDLTFFWYYVGLKYLPTLWSDWYSIWKLENKRAEPREAVLKKLAKEIAHQFNYHIFPFVAKAIEEGDTTLKPLLKELNCCSYHESLLYHSFKSTVLPFESPRLLPIDDPQFNDEKSFLIWWNKYKDNYIVPASEKKLSDIKNIFERKNPPDFFTKEMYKSALKAEKALDEYCKLENRPLTNCWYFYIKDGDLEK